MPTVPPCSVADKIQLESGFSWEHEDRGASLTKTFTLPQVEVHAGLARRFEVSLAWDGLVSTAAARSVPDMDGSGAGWADVRLGAKLGLVNRPSVDAALIGYAELPVGSGSVSSGYADPLVRFAWSISLTDRIALWGTADLGAAREADGGVRAKPAANVSLGTTVVGSLNVFFGIVAESPPIGSRPNLWSMEAGFVLPLGASNQIDVWGSRRFAGRPDAWFVGAGFVRRLR